jgi:general secretion pathway protein F
VRTFAYKGFDATGAARRGLIEALDIKEARDKLAARGLFPEHVAPAGREAAERGDKGDRGLGLETRVAFYRELGVLTGAGLPLVHALEILMESPELGVSPVLLATVRDRVREGAGLSAALGAVTDRVRPFERAILEVGEKSGTLDAILERLAGFLEEQQQLRERVVSALLYPVIILGFALVVAVVMLGFVVPSAAAAISREVSITLPRLTRIMIGVGRGLVWGLPVAIAAAAGGLWWLRHRLAARASTRLTLERLGFRLPLIGRGWGLIVNLRCARTMSILLKGGVPLVDALGLAGRSTGSEWVAGELERETNTVRHGSSLADALRRVPVLSVSLPAWIQAGEASGSLEKMLDTAGDAYQHQWNRFVSRTLSWLEPALIGLVGLFVFVVVLSVLLPIIALNKSLG